MTPPFKHGEILERAIRARGVSFASLAKMVAVSRRTIYNWVKAETLEPHIFNKVGEAIGHDFTNDISHLLKLDKRHTPVSEEGLEWQQKYLELLERYVTLRSAESINKRRLN